MGGLERAPARRRGRSSIFTAVAALEFGGRGITVNAVAPGATDTELLRSSNPGETFEDVVAQTALQRLGQPGDIARVVAFLAGPDSGWMTGQGPAGRRRPAALSPRLAAMNTLEEWTAAAGAGLGLDPGPLSTAETKAVLDLSRDVAHAVDRVAAPLTAYLLGVAVGRGLTLPEAADRVRALAVRWPESAEPPPATQP